MWAWEFRHSRSTCNHVPLEVAAPQGRIWKKDLCLVGENYILGCVRASTSKCSDDPLLGIGEGNSVFGSTASICGTDTLQGLPPNLDANPTSKFGKIMYHNLTTPIANHWNKQENAGLMNDCYVVGVTTIPYPKLWSVHQHHLQWWHHMPCHNWQHCTCMDFTKMSLSFWESKGNKYITNIFIMCLFICEGGLQQWHVHSHSTLLSTTRLCNYLNLPVV